MASPLQKCPVCEASGWVEDRIAGQMLGLPGLYKVLLCKTCAQRRLDPQLMGDELKALYSDAYFNSAQAVQSLEVTVKMASSDYITEIAPSRRAQFRRTIQKLKRLHAGSKTFLDVGAATGDMVKIALDHGLTADGIELSDFAVKMAKELYSIDLQQNVIGELDRTGYYDLIHLNHVFEHFNDPATELGHLHRLLKRGGVLFIEVPYQFSLLEKLLFKLRGGQADFNLYSLHHPYFYTPATIERLLRRHDFEVIECSVFDPERYPSDTFVKKVKLNLWRLLSLLSIGGYIMLVARRPLK
jgi:SAM-dependent methyltransferase